MIDVIKHDCTQHEDMVKYQWNLFCDFLQFTKHLENMKESHDCMPLTNGGNNMAKINRAVMINGSKRWIRANTEQEYADKLIAISAASIPGKAEKHNFRVYAWNWFNLYSAPNIETATEATYRRQLTLYLIPAFGDRDIEDLTVDDVQLLFNSMDGAKTTKDKTKMVLSMVFDAAIEDGYCKESRKIKASQDYRHSKPCSGTLQRGANAVYRSTFG